MRFLSLFSGIEGASVAWCKPPLNWECVGFSEIEPFPCALLQHYYSDVPNLGDITKITEEQIAALGHIDLVIFGSPCTDFSVAGKRAGLKDEEGNITRSGLFYTAMDIVRFARKRCGLRWAILENVPGIYSSHEGRDFSTVIGEMVGCGFDVPAKGWGNSGIAIGPDGLCEWACLDARHFGVAQRRRRVFAVCDYAIFDSGNWRSRSSVLLERKGLRGNSSTSREEGEDVAGTIASRFGASRNNPEELAPIGIDEEGNATKNGIGPLMRGGEGGTKQAVACYENHAQDSRIKDCGDLAPQLNAKAGTGGNNLPLVQNLKPQAMRMVAHGEYANDDSGSTMKSRDHKDATDLVIVGAPKAFNPQSGGDCRGLDLRDTAQLQRHQVTGCLVPKPVAVDIYNTKIDGDVCATLSNEGGSSTGSGPKVLAFAQNTLDEVRLQGGDGQNVGALAAEPGMKQTTYLAIERPVATAIQGMLLGRGENSEPEGSGLSEELSFTLTKNDVHAVAVDLRNGIETGDVTQTIQSHHKSNSLNAEPTLMVAIPQTMSMALRRLTPEECEVLQGFPRKYTKIPWKKKPAEDCPDGPRYKALGNSFAVPVIAYIGRRIQKVMDEQHA